MNYAFSIISIYRANGSINWNLTFWEKVVYYKLFEKERKYLL